MGDPNSIAPRTGGTVQQRHADKGSTAPQQGTKPKPPAKKEPLGYDRSIYDVKPDRNTTRSEMDAQLNLSVSQGHVITGTTTDEEYVAVGAAIDHAANNQDAWGKEVDVNVKIAGRERHVTVRLNHAGKVEAELLPDTGPWQGTKSFKTAAEGIKALKQDFGIEVVPKGKELDDNWDGKSKDFTAGELEKIYDGISKLSPGEQEALKGVKLARVKAFDDGSAGMFESGTSVVKGVTKRDDRLVYADSTFEGDKTGFIGGAKDASPASLETISHEIGHAVETAGLRKAQLESANALAAANRDMKKPWNAVNQGLTRFNITDPAAEEFAGKVNAAQQALDELRLNDDPAQGAALRKAAKDAMAEAQTAMGAVPKGQQAKAGQIMTSLGEVEKVVTKRADALDALDAADGKDGSHSTRLESFMKMIDQNKVKPFTKYAAESMGKADPEPDEFFAEAFAIYKRDPEFLSKNYPEVHKWFADGNHLK